MSGELVTLGGHVRRHAEQEPDRVVLTILSDSAAPHPTAAMALTVSGGWHRGPAVSPFEDPADLGPAVAKLLAAARLNADMTGVERDGPGRPSRD